MVAVEDVACLNDQRQFLSFSSGEIELTDLTVDSLLNGSSEPVLVDHITVCVLLLLNNVLDTNSSHIHCAGVGDDVLKL